MKFEPFPYQHQMVRWLHKRRRAALFCSPGLGKTVCTLKAYQQLSTDGASKGMLIIAPLRVCNITWPNEAEKWDFCRSLRLVNLRTQEGIQAWEEQSADIYVINSEQLPSRDVKRKCPSCKKDPRLRRTCRKCRGRGYLKTHYPGFVEKYIAKRSPEQLPVDMICVDELSLAKNPQSKRFNALRAFRGMFNRVWGLTGSPVPNNYLDLWAQVRFLDNGKRLSPSYTHYQDTYFFPDAGGYSFSLREGAREKIEKKIADIALTMLGDDYLDVPVCTTTDEEVELTPAARKDYTTLKKELLLQLETGDIEALSAAVLTMKLLQLTGGAAYGAEEIVNGKLVKPIHYIHDNKIKALKRIRLRHGSEPMLVLTQFKHEQARILEAIPGATMFDEKRMKDWQAKKIHTWVADPRSLSHGIDGLQVGGRIACWFTLTYSNETYLQTCARLVRTGQSFETIIYRIIAKGTVDEAVAEALRTKSNEQSGLLNALKALQRLEKAK